MNPYRENAMSDNQEYRKVLVSAIDAINERIAFVGTLTYNNESTRADRLKVLFARQNELLDRLKNA